MSTHLLFLYDCSKELREEISTNGSLKCINTPPIYLGQPEIVSRLTEEPLLPKEAINELRKCLAVFCDHDPTSAEPIDHLIENFAISLQLVRPIRCFLQYKLQIGSDSKVKSVSSPTRRLPLTIMSANPYLQYQKLHCISLADVNRAIAIFPVVSRVRSLGPGSWTHPCGSIHRALIFFCQGYSVRLDPLPQVLWAAGLDCLFASKQDRTKHGAKTISARLQALFGSNYQPYASPMVRVPSHQKTRKVSHTLKEVAEHIFWLRNAFMHGGPIPDPNWLINPDQPPESGYAYQLLECTEILLRETLLRLFEDSSLLRVFLDPMELDTYFSKLGC